MSFTQVVAASIKHQEAWEGPHAAMNTKKLTYKSGTYATEVYLGFNSFNSYRDTRFVAKTWKKI